LERIFCRFGALLLLYTFYQPHAMATVMTGNQFLEFYSRYSAQENIYLNGYIAGVWDTMELNYPDVARCVGTEIKMSQLRDAVAIYLKKNPQILNFSLAQKLPEAIKSQFGC
jgi:Rap1a immunity proteins